MFELFYRNILNVIQENWVHMFEYLVHFLYPNQKLCILIYRNSLTSIWKNSLLGRNHMVSTKLWYNSG